MDILQFKPLLKSALWGGKRIFALKEIPATDEPIGESWEISTFPDNETLVTEGELKGLSLTEIIKLKKEEVLGRHVWQRYGTEFPLLIKIIDAAKDLSVQVHPDDATAQTMGQPRGKTEMWYAMDAPEGTTLVNGLTPSTKASEVADLLAHKELDAHLSTAPVHPGDCFFIEAGTVHSIGGGCLMVEIQQSSNTTYRLYDFNRPDANGKLRPLQIPEAVKSIKPLTPKEAGHFARTKENESTKMVECPYFTTCKRSLSKTATLDYSPLDSFVILTAVEGSATLTTKQGQVVELKKGHSAFIPATAGCMEIVPTTPHFSMLEIYIGE